MKGRYIVVLEDRDGRNAAVHAATLAKAHQGKVISVYDAVLSGFSVEMPEAAALALSRNPNVRFVEEDVQGSISSLSASMDTGDPSNGLWHLDRSDERQVDDGGLDGKFGWCRTGQDVYVYVVDTGIRRDHTQVIGRVLPGVNVTNSTDGSADDPCVADRLGQSQGGHGTAVASVLAGSTIGVARGATLIPVRTHRCEGLTFLTWVLDGLNWINSAANPDRIHRPAVVNMSFWFPKVKTTQDANTLSSIEEAIAGLEQAGFAIFVAANNQPIIEEGGPNIVDACDLRPSSYARSNGGRVVTVGGTMLGPNRDRDFRWWTGDGVDQGSSHGACVDIWAPAQGLKVADYSTTSGYKLSSGTSYSSPIVAGIAARWLQYNQYLTPAELWTNVLLPGATKLDSSGGDLIWEPQTSPDVADETMPNNQLVHLKENWENYCRNRPVKPVSITGQPVSWVLPAGSQVSLSVETDEWVDYQWYRGSSGDMSQPMWGATSSSYTIPPLAATTSYWVRVIGEINAVNSSAATITLSSCPGISIQTQPQGAEVLQGQSHTLAVAATSVNPISYQWYAGSTPIPNSNKATITVSPSQETGYRVVMTNGCGTTYSSWAFVSVVREYLVAFRTYYWNFIGADNCGGSGVHATAGLPYECERFVLRDLNGGELVHEDFVTLRSYNGYYMVAEWGGGPGQTVNADRTAAGPWETFQILNMDGGYWIMDTQNVALKTSGGYFVVAEYGGINGGGPGAGDVNCDRTQAGPWEIFQILWQ